MTNAAAAQYAHDLEREARRILAERPGTRPETAVAEARAVLDRVRRVPPARPPVPVADVLSTILPGAARPKGSP